MSLTIDKQGITISVDAAIAIMLVCVVVLICIVCIGLGASIARDNIISACDKRGEFSRLSGDGDETFNCSRKQFFNQGTL